MEEEEQRNINLTEGEVQDLRRALKCLMEKEQKAKETRDYTDLIYKLNGWYD